MKILLGVPLLVIYNQNTVGEKITSEICCDVFYLSERLKNYM